MPKLILMSAAEIISELPKLTIEERLSVLRKLQELGEEPCDDCAPSKGPSENSSASSNLSGPASLYRTVDLRSRGIGPEQAANLRARLTACLEDWERPEASIYDEDQER